MYKTHDRSRTPEYRTWVKLRWRCDPRNAADFPNYAGRGITVSPLWLGRGGFEAFLRHVGKRPSPLHSIDRIDNDGHYEPGNVRWATKSEQGLNRRKRPHGLFVGEKNGQAKLSAESVRALRERRRTSGISYAKLALEFDISTSQAFRICRGHSW